MPALLGDKHAAMRWLALGMLTFQNGLTPLIFRYATTGGSKAERFDSTQAVLVQEILKVVMSFVLLFVEEEYRPDKLAETLQREIVEKRRSTVKLGIPALLYFIQNTVIQMAAANLPAAVFAVTYQGRTLVVAIFAVLLLSTKLSIQKWFSLLVLGISLAGVQLSKSTETGTSMTHAHEQNEAQGLLYVLVGCLCTGFASVYFEKMMKHGHSAGEAPPSMWVRNVQLASFSIVIGTAQLFGRMLTMETKPLLHGFNVRVWIMVFNNAIGGLLVAMVIKYADNLQKGFACAVATIWATIASVFVFGFTLKPMFALGGAGVIFAVLLYGGQIKLPGTRWEEEPTLCADMRKMSGAASIEAEIPTMNEADVENAPLLNKV